MVIKKRPNPPADDTSKEAEPIEELVRIWEDDTISVDDKLSATFRGLGHLLEPQIQADPKGYSSPPKKRH